MPMLETRNLVKAWPGLSIKVDLKVEPGEFLVIVGPSGCGKSSLLRMIAGLLEPDSGTILIDGNNIGALPAQDRGVGMVFQDYALFPHLSVEENIGYGLRCRHVPRNLRQSKIEELLTKVGLRGFNKRCVSELSGGEKQRIALARTLATDPAIILFDEPFSSLDTQLRKQLREQLRSEQRELGFTAIHVTHDLEEALVLADRIAVMRRGRIEQLDVPERLWHRPGNLEIAHLLGNLVMVKTESLGLAGAESGTWYCGNTPQPSPEITANATTVAFHPADCQLLQADQPVQYPVGLYLAGICIEQRFLGDYCDYVLDIGGKEVRLRLPPLGFGTTGQRICLHVPAERLLWYNKLGHLAASS